MQFTYKRNNLPDTHPAEALIELKYPALAKYWRDDATVLCEIEFEKVAPKKAGAVYRVEANLTVDGSLYRAEATLESLEQALDEVRNELDKELRRTKKKGETLFKKGARAGKEMLRKSI